MAEVIRVEWCEPVDGPALREVLDAVERDRVAALVRPADRARFVTGRWLLRAAAAAVTGAAPRDVAVRVRCTVCGGPHGKPAVDGLEASLAHSGERVVLAWRERGAVGVDVEQRRPEVADELADQVFAPGEDRTDLFGTWARKEAVLKLRGTGLAEPMTGLRVDDPAHHVTDLDLGAGYAAAVASRDRRAGAAGAPRARRLSTRAAARAGTTARATLAPCTSRTPPWSCSPAPPRRPPRSTTSSRCRPRRSASGRSGPSRSSCW